jgi:biofilm protein TabA
MIIDSLQNADKYKTLHPRFAQAFDFILAQNAAAIKPGSIQLDGDNLKAIMIEEHSMTEQQSLEGFECHNTYIDIQVPFHGIETYAWKPRQNCQLPQAPYDEQKDVTLFKDAPDTFFTLQPGQFVIFYPDDVHTAMISEDRGLIRKVVMKVKV